MDTSKTSRAHRLDHKPESPNPPQPTVIAHNNGAETINKATQREGMKQTRSQRRKRKLESGGLSDGVAVVEATTQDGEKESRTQRRKRKREEHEESDGIATQDEIKSRRTHENGPESDQTQGVAIADALSDSSRPPKDDSGCRDTIVIRKNMERRVHKDPGLTARERKKQRKRECRTKRQKRGRNSEPHGDLIEGSSVLNAVLEPSESMALWKISEAIGGRLIHADPVFSGDEKWV
jgi:hypothetical protein